jgi:hypothetical protein
VKRILSIPLILLIVFSGINVRFATHYCGGSVAATKVSLNGELATCGMEKPSGNNLLQDIYTKQCCDDITSAYSICNNYIPSSYSNNEVGQQVLSFSYIPYHNLISEEIIINSLNTTIRPPGTSLPNKVSLPYLCIFRI